MPKQRPLESRIEEKEAELLRLKVLKKISDLQGQLPSRPRRRKRG